jgi:hypothetical protein
MTEYQDAGAPSEPAPTQGTGRGGNEASTDNTNRGTEDNDNSGRHPGESGNNRDTQRQAPGVSQDSHDSSKPRNQIFTGRVELTRLDQRQTFEHVVGLRVTSEPAGGAHVKDKIVLDNIRLSASKLKPVATTREGLDGEGNNFRGRKTESQDDGFAIQEVRVTVEMDSVGGAVCIDSKPKEADFVQEISLGSKTNMEGS